MLFLGQFFEKDSLRATGLVQLFARYSAFASIVLYVGHVEQIYADLVYTLEIL